MFNTIQKANLLIEALPYIRKFYGKTIVIKYGGNAMINDELKEAVMNDVILMKYVGMNPVIVHGGGPEITGMLNKLGLGTEFVGGLRYTDKETMEVVEMVLVGKVNKEIVAMLNRFGGKAVGLSGKDGNLLQAVKKMGRTYDAAGNETLQDIGFVGDVSKVNPEIIDTVIKEGYIPVIAPVGVDEDGFGYNINADYVAGEVAAALNADKLIMLTDIDGVYEDFKDKSSFISTLNIERVQDMVRQGIIDGGMIPKLEACVKALEGGVEKAHIIDGRVAHSILLEIFTDQGIGTMVVK